MMTLSEAPSVLSSPQRRCQVLLMFYLPGQSVTSDYIGLVNQVDDNITRQDIAETHDEIQRYHQLNIVPHTDGSYRIEGTTLDQRLCLLHWLRRALRLCPQFITHLFAPAIKAQLHQSGISRLLYDDTNLHALVNRCARRLQRHFDGRDMAFLRLYLQYCLLQQQPQNAPDFNPSQRQWAKSSAEFQVAADIARHWQRRTRQDAHPDEHLFLTLLFMLLKVPDPRHDYHTQDVQLYRTVNQLIDRFQKLTHRPFSNRQGLRDQLYVHLAQAMNRCLYGIGIDNSLPDEIHRLYPRLIRATRESLADVETRFNIHFSREEIGLIGVIFGAWLMQDNDLQEKQVVILTAGNPELERNIEQQLRELTLLPLNIKYLTLNAFQKEGVAKDITLVITPYVTPLPLFSPPIIHAGDQLSANQCQHICQMLEDDV